MTIVKELNNLAEKITGDNPKARTDAQAVKYISDNYSGGGGDSDSEPLVLDIVNAINAFYDNNEADTEYILTSAENAKVSEIKTALTSNPKQFIYLDCGDGQYMLANCYVNATNQLNISAMSNYYFQGTATIFFVSISDGAVYIGTREYTKQEVEI